MVSYQEKDTEEKSISVDGENNISDKMYLLTPQEAIGHFSLRTKTIKFWSTCMSRYSLGGIHSLLPSSSLLVYLFQYLQQKAFESFGQFVTPHVVVIDFFLCLFSQRIYISTGITEISKKFE